MNLPSHAAVVGTDRKIEVGTGTSLVFAQKKEK
jgi:hypothetical protein